MAQVLASHEGGYGHYRCDVGAKVKKAFMVRLTSGTKCSNNLYVATEKSTNKLMLLQH